MLPEIVGLIAIKGFIRLVAVLVIVGNLKVHINVSSIFYLESFCLYCHIYFPWKPNLF